MIVTVLGVEVVTVTVLFGDVVIVLLSVLFKGGGDSHCIVGKW